ncbi:MAG TPA: bacillithiol biosynthesis BshC [Gemmatimonadaceae bacterium]
MSAKPATKVMTEPLGGSALSVAAQAGKLPRAIQPWRPRSTAEWRAHVKRCRAALSKDWAQRLGGALQATGAAADRLGRVTAGSGVVVTTGQQPGLLGGPLYTLAKALSALELADVIERKTGVPTAPIFWAATDDSDFAEASVAAVSGAGGLRELSQTERPPSGTRMAEAPLGDLSGQLDALREACGSAPHAHFLEMAAKAYGARAATGAAYVQLLRELLEPLGIAVLDASHPACGSAARPVLAAALSAAQKISTAAAERAKAIRSAGYEPQVEDDRGLSLVFIVEQGIKRRLTVAEAATVPASAVLSPNVLLRPIVEREIVPTVAYVGGPGEIAYFTQADAVASALGRERLVVVPRWSCTIVEPFVERALKRIGVKAAELKNLHAVEKRLARKALPDSVSKAWKALNDQVAASVAKLARAVKVSDLVPPPVIEGLSNSLKYRLARGERRLLAAAKRRDDAVRRDLVAASAALWPNGHRQERTLNFIPMLARGGDALLRELRKGARQHAAQLVGK